MKTLCKPIAGWIIILLILSGISSLKAQENSEDYFTISGIVKDKNTKKRLEYVNITIPGSNIGTVTNGDGEFLIKVGNSVTSKNVEVSHIGYHNYIIPVKDHSISDLTIWLTPNSNILQEVIIHAQDPRSLVEAAISKISSNYSPKNNLFTGFYRETAQKGRHYINISEAIIDIYKTYYSESVGRDRVQVFKGRKLLSQKQNDTLVVKLLGGPNLSIYADVAKNPDILLDLETLPYYSFRMEESTVIDDRPHYVISFHPQAILPYALYYGKLYIDKENMAFSRAEFSLSMDDRNKATQAILKKKPFGLRFKPLEVSFLVTYKQRNKISYLSYIRNEVRFKCDWKRKLFSTNYTILSEMVITDGKEQKEGFPYKAAFKSNQSLSDKVEDFMDEDFWGAYNIIEPTESLESAVYKLKKQQN